MNKIIASIMSNQSLSLDAAILLVGTIDNAQEEENVEIYGEMYYYDDLDLLKTDNGYDIIQR